ncbi:hypothetical protein M9458_026346, partial [Cirrhinus mrigala]
SVSDHASDQGSRRQRLHSVSDEEWHSAHRGRQRPQDHSVGPRPESRERHR